MFIVPLNMTSTLDRLYSLKLQLNFTRSLEIIRPHSDSLSTEYTAFSLVYTNASNADQTKLNVMYTVQQPGGDATCINVH